MRGLRMLASSTRTPRSSACATSSPVRSTTSILKLCSISDRASLRWRRGSRRTRVCADCRPSSASSSTRLAPCRLATSMRTFALKSRAMAQSRCILRATMRWLRNARRMRRAMSRRGWASRSSLLPAPATLRRDGCARWWSGRARPPCLPRRVARRSRARARDDAPRSVTSSACASSVRRRSSARRRPSAKSRRFNSGR